jgi:Tfp pilus assembly protein PilO
MNVSPQKRKQLIQLGIITLVVLLAIWFALIQPARKKLKGEFAKQADLQKQLDAKKQIFQRAEQIRPQLAVYSNELHAIEGQMVTGDTYLWIIKTLREFEIPDKLEFTRYDPPQLADSNLPKNSRYKAVTFSVNGLATYQEIGKFLARFENAYPHTRIQRLEMEPAGIPAIYDEKISFLMDIFVLVKPPQIKNAPSL